MASCLNTSSKPGDSFDVEAFQKSDGTQQQQHRAAAGSGSGGSGRARRCCSPVCWLASAALAAALLALLFSIYAAVIGHRGLKAARGQDVLLASRPSSLPDGYRTAGSLWRGSGYYARMVPMLYARSDHRTLPVGNTVYIIGGLTNALALAAPSSGAAASATQQPRAQVLNHTTAFNTYTQAYTRVADMPQPRYRMCGAVLDGQVYVAGGMPLYEGPTAPSHTVADTLMRFNPESDSWTVLPGRMRHPRADCCAAAVGGKLYVAGGWTTDYADTLGSVEVWDPASGGWALAPNLTLPRGDCEAVAVNDRHMLVIGGVAPDGNFTASVEALDTSTAGASWQARASLSRPRGDFAAEALPGGRVIVMGGETTNGTATEFAQHEAEEYAFEADAWTPKAPLPEARFRFDTAHVGEMVYIFGGAPTCVSGQVSDGAKQPCLGVALNSTYGYFDVRHPDVWIATRD